MTSIQQISAPFVKWQPSCSSRHKQKDEDFRELEEKVRQRRDGVAPAFQRIVARE